MANPFRGTMRFFSGEAQSELDKSHADLRGSLAEATKQADAFVAWSQAPPERRLPSGTSCGDCECFGCKCQGLGQMAHQRVCLFSPSAFAKRAV